MRYLVFIALFFSFSSSFGASGFKGDLIEARDNLKALCELYPNRPLCPGKDFDLRTIDGDERSIREEVEMIGILEGAAISLFPFKDKIRNGGKLNRQEKETYLEKFRYLDRISRLGNSYEKRIIEIMLGLTSLEWLNTFGDPTSEDDSLTDQDETLAGRSSVLDQMISANNYAIATFGVGILAEHGKNKFLRNTSNGIKYLAAGIRARVPAWAFTSAGLAILSGSSFYGASQIDGISTILPTPAHLIRFELSKNIDGSDLDFQAIWAEKEQKIYEDLTADAGFWVGVYRGNVASLRTAMQMRSARMISIAKWKFLGRVGKVGRFMRITPAGLVLGFGAEMVARSGYKLYKLIDIEHKIANAIDNDDALEFHYFLNRLSIVRSDSLLYAKNAISIYQHVAKAYLGLQRGDTEKYRQARRLLNRDLLSLNLPTYTGAQKVRELVCSSNIDATPEGREARRRHPRRIRAWQGRARTLANDMREKIQKARAGQTLYLQHLQGMKNRGGLTLALFKIRRQSDPTDHPLSAKLERVLDYHIRRAQNNIKYFEDVLKTKQWSVNILVGTLSGSDDQNKLGHFPAWLTKIRQHTSTNATSADYFGCGNL